jgi:hypothetical protein
MVERKQTKLEGSTFEVGGLLQAGTFQFSRAGAPLRAAKQG